jgi:Mn-dependent DtxR family transcriptional regulator
MRKREGYYPEKIRDLAYLDQLEKLNKSQRRVYNIIKEYGPCSTEFIAITLNCYPHQITPRVYELREMGLVYFYDVGISPTSGKAVSLWKAKKISEQLRLDFQ